jgi:hypothetical protein
MSDVDFGEFEISTTHKPVAGVTNVEIPEKLAAALAVEVPKVLGSKDLNLHLTARDEKTAKMIAGWVKAWGGRQDPKLYIRRLPNTRDQKDNTVRFDVKLDSEVDQANRPGRRVADAPAPSPADVPKAAKK